MAELAVQHRQATPPSLSGLVPHPARRRGGAGPPHVGQGPAAPPANAPELIATLTALEIATFSQRATA